MALAGSCHIHQSRNLKIPDVEFLDKQGGPFSSPGSTLPYHTDQDQKTTKQMHFHISILTVLNQNPHTQSALNQILQTIETSLKCPPDKTNIPHDFCANLRNHKLIETSSRSD